jgi:ABC-2 type transport system ATP-binding protein
MTVIEATGLARTFRSRKGAVEAVRGVDLDVREGEIVGFLGPNGAGKTTTLRMLTTLLRPTAGAARIAGVDLLAHPARVRGRIGYVAQQGGTGAGYRVEEELMLQSRLHRLGDGPARRRIALLLEQLSLTGLENRLVGTLSGGQRRRLDIALGLIHTPRVLFLDEPTAGLDPHSRGNLWKTVRALRDEGSTTVFLTTHYLEEADALCDRILVIDHGRIIAEDSSEGLKRRLSSDVVTIEAEGDLTAGCGELARLGGVRDVTVRGGAIRLSADSGDRAMAEAITALSRAGLDVRSVTLTRPTLEEAFLTLTGRGPRDSVTADR